MSKKSKRYGNFRKRKRKMYMGTYRPLSPVEALTLGMEFHFESLFEGDYSDEEFNRRMDSLSCIQCRDYLSGECPGRSLQGMDVVECIGLQMGVVPQYERINEFQYIQ